MLLFCLKIWHNKYLFPSTRTYFIFFFTHTVFTFQEEWYHHTEKEEKIFKLLNKIFPTSFFTWARLLETILYYHQIKNILHKENILLFHSKVFTVNTTQILFTTDIDIIGHHSYHKGLLVSKLCKVWHAFEIEKPIINRLVYPVYTWVKCTKFKLSVSIYITYQWIFMW